MATLTVKLGPRGTEFLTRRKRLVGDESSGRSPATAPENGAWRLREIAEQGNQALVATEAGQSQDLQAKLEQARHQRRQFWIDTCREVLEMRTASPRIMELHRRHGCRFSVPNPRQVQHILDALDAALPDWDRGHPELFYQTLELNFPELLRAYRWQARL